MYCKKCGNPIEETDIACKICGALRNSDSFEETPPQQNAAEAEDCAKTEAETENDEKRPKWHTEFNWNVYDFPKPKKTEDLNLSWSAEKIRAEAEAKLRLAGVEPDQQETVPEPTIETEVIEEPEKQAEAEAARERSVQEIEKFFTFTKKNEEFQLLLDKEYEKLKNRREGDPYIEPEMNLQEDRQIVLPNLSDEQSELDRMILEGTTSVETAPPIEDLLHRRTIPVDLAQIQKAAKLAAGELAPSEQAGVKQRPTALMPEERPVVKPEAEPEARAVSVEKLQVSEEELPAIELPRKSVEDIISDYQSVVLEAEEESESADAQIELFAEMTAARESFLKQLEAEREALHKAEEEAIKRGVREAEAQERWSQQSYQPRQEFQQRNQPQQEMQNAPQPQPEMAVNRIFSGANAEIQVTVAVKANGGMPNQESVSILQSGPSPGSESYRSDPYRTEAYRAEPYRTEPYRAEPVASEDKRSADLQAEAASPYSRTRVIDAEAVKIVKEEQKKPEVFDQAVSVAASDTVVRAAVEREPWHENTMNSLFPMGPAEPEAEEDEPERKRGGRVGKIALVIIAVVLILEILALGVKYFAPESAAGEAVKAAEIKAVEVFGGAVQGVSDFFEEMFGNANDPASGENEAGMDSEEIEGAGENPEGSVIAPPDPVPMADKTALIATQSSKNKNIKEVSASDDLKYRVGKDYGVKDINSSKPIEYNIWKTLSTGETLYYDRAVVGTIIAFNSQWQDYVNHGTEDVFSLTKEGSKAYKNAVAYSMVGKEVQSFESLQFGEIRVGSNGFYVWTKEEIKKTQSGKTNTVTNHWIYYLESVGDEMKVVSYTEF